MVTPEAALEAARSHMRGPLLWGQADCARAACRAWAALWRRPDPMARVVYADEAQALAILERAGGFPAWADRTLGLRRSLVMAAGDLVLVPNDGPFRAAMGLCVGGLVAVKGEQGMSLTRREPVGVWTCRSF